MIISVNWLRKYLGQKVDIDQLTERIGSRLVEIESVAPLADKYRSPVIVKVVDCVPHPDSDHMHVCQIDDGGVVVDAERNDDGYVQVVCGAPNVHTGMLAVWLPPCSIVPESYGTDDEFKLSSRKLRGVMSHGMLASPRELGLWNEHEGIMEIGAADAIDVRVGAKLSDYLDLDDYLLEVENKSLTHRPDCFGVIGFAREVAAIMGQSADIPDWFNNLDGKLTVDKPAVKPTVAIADSSLCARYECVALDDIDSGCQLSDEMRSLLGRVGVNSISAPVDITNYLMLDSGQPLHAFDLDKIIEVSPTGRPDIIVRAASKGETLELLDGRTIALSPADIVVAAGDAASSVPIALAGAMGGMATEITPQTRRVLLESATFDLYHLRGTQFRHGIFSEAITRFTKGQPAQLTHPVLLRAVDMLCRYAGATVISDVAEAASPVELPTGYSLPVRRVSAVLGQYDDGDTTGDYSANLIATTLRNLQYDDVAVVSTDGGDVVAARAPWWRTDLHIEEDLIEDIGRVNGYDNIVPDSPRRRFTAAPYDELYEAQMYLRNRLKEAGGNEVITYSFIHGDLLRHVHDGPDQAYRIVNAISPDLQYYRRDLLPNLVERARDNLRAGYNNFMLFEIGKVHRQGLMDENEPDLPAELPELSGIVVDKNARTDSAYYTAKKVIEYALNLNDKLQFTRLDQYGGDLDGSTNIYEPLRSAVVSLDDDGERRYVGVVGELKADVRRRFKLPDFVAGYSLMLSPLVDLLDQTTTYTPVLRYQGTSRDVTYKVSVDTNYDEVLTFTQRVLATKLNDDIAIAITPKDIYDTDDGHRHVTLHIEFHDRQRTIDAKLVNKSMERLAKQAGNEHDWVIV